MVILYLPYQRKCCKKLNNCDIYVKKRQHFKLNLLGGFCIEKKLLPIAHMIKVRPNTDNGMFRFVIFPENQTFINLDTDINRNDRQRERETAQE